jgi:hypothetical protein
LSEVDELFSDEVVVEAVESFESFEPFEPLSLESVASPDFDVDVFDELFLESVE